MSCGAFAKTCKGIRQIPKYPLGGCLGVFFRIVTTEVSIWDEQNHSLAEGVLSFSQMTDWGLKNEIVYCCQYCEVIY